MQQDKDTPDKDCSKQKLGPYEVSLTQKCQELVNLHNSIENIDFEETGFTQRGKSCVFQCSSRRICSKKWNWN